MRSAACQVETAGYVLGLGLGWPEGKEPRLKRTVLPVVELTMLSASRMSTSTSASFFLRISVPSEAEGQPLNDVIASAWDWLWVPKTYQVVVCPGSVFGARQLSTARRTTAQSSRGVDLLRYPCTLIAVVGFI